MAEKARAVNCGGIGAIHLMINKLGLRQEIDSQLHLLKKHLPYHESDHGLNLTYNALLEGVRLEDIELRRNDEAFLDGLGAQRIPDPTTSGDFRPFAPAQIWSKHQDLRSISSRPDRRQTSLVLAAECVGIHPPRNTVFVRQIEIECLLAAVALF